MVQYNEDQQPVGDTGRELKSFIGTLAKYCDIIPVIPCSWRYIDNNVKEAAWAEIWVR